MKNKNKKLLVIVVIFAISLFASACTRSNTNPPSNVPPPNNAPPVSEPAKETNDDVSLYFPMKVGDKWTYKGTGNEYASYIQEVVFNKDNRFQLRIDNGGTSMANVYEVSKEKIVNTFKAGEQYENKNMLNEPSNLNIIMLQLPIKVGNTWTSEENNYEVIDINKSITVPAGTFDSCIIVKETYKEGTSYQLIYYKKGIGIVKAEFHSDGQDIITSDLESYDIK